MRKYIDRTYVPIYDIRKEVGMLCYILNRGIFMTAYELMVKTNHYLLKGGTLTDGQKANIVSQFMAVKSGGKMRYSNNGCDKRRMYPEFFIPPYNDGKKLRTIFNQASKTQILSANLYELEILRLLFIFVPESEDVKYMVTETLKRLKTTCFGFRDDGLGECFDASLVVLRFLITVAPNETKWIQSRIDNYNRHYGEKKRPKYCRWYYWLCLSELPFEIAKPEIEKNKEEILDLLVNKSYAVNSERDKIIYPVVLCMLRNIIAKYPEYTYIMDRTPYMGVKDGRLRFDMGK